jgi:hypothetical protein
MITRSHYNFMEKQFPELIDSGEALKTQQDI